MKRGKRQGSRVKGEVQPTADGPQLVTFADLVASAEALRDAGDKPGLLRLAQSAREVAVEEVPDSVSIDVWLAHLTLEGLITQSAEMGRIWLNTEQTPIAKPALEILAYTDRDFVTRPEFDLFLQVHAHGPKSALQVYPHLVEACRRYPDRYELLDRLRGVVFTLADQDGWEEDERVAPSLIEQLGPAPVDVLADLIDEALAGVDSEEERLRLRVYRLDLDFRLAEPWDYGQVAQAARALEPHPDSFSTDVGQDVLTPMSWGFLYEVRWAGDDSYPDLLIEYPTSQLHTRLARGFSLLLNSLQDLSSESRLIEALEVLFDASREGDSVDMGSEIIVKGMAPHVLPIGFVDLAVPTLAEILLHIIEMIGEEHPFNDRLVGAYLVWSAEEDFGSMDPEALKSLDLAQAHEWLCDKLPRFKLQLAEKHPSLGKRMTLVLEEIVRCARDHLPPPGRISVDLDEAEISAEDRESVVGLLRTMSVYSGALRPELQAEWVKILPAIIRALREGASKPELVELVEVARNFEGDMDQGGALPTLAYLEHVCGEPTYAAIHYGEIMREDAGNADWAKSNLRHLVTLSRDVDQARSMLETLERGMFSLAADAVALARARYKELNDQAQFERSATARWPSLTAPARKLLTVLSTIDGFASREQLAQFAAMDVEWVDRHWKKLIDLGMVFGSIGGDYEINKYILPLIERENQHAVVGRIIRSNGTSAVTQVFKSVREFGIYQVLVQLCPNHLVFPNCALQSFMQFERMKELVDQDDFSYYLKASVDIVIVSSTTFLPMLAIEVDSAWHDTDRQQTRDERKDRLFAAAGVPFLRLRQFGSPSEHVIRGQVAQHLHELVSTLRTDLPGYDRARELLVDLARITSAEGVTLPVARPSASS